MKDFEIVAGVFIAIFIIGIGVGVIAVAAMSTLKRHRDIRQGDLLRGSIRLEGTRRRPPGPRYDPAPPRDAPPDPGNRGRPSWPDGDGFEDHF